MQVQRARKAPKVRYWYRRHVGECPVCGRDQSYRERVYGPKPKHPTLLVVQLTDFQSYDGCLERG